jgi:hypothetical protein
VNSKSKRKRDHHRDTARKRYAGGKDVRRAEAVTVAWVTSTLATACAMGLSLLAIWLTGSASPSTSDRSFLNAILPLMLFTGAVTGLVALCLTPLVYFFRRVPPPILITVLAVAIAVSPIVALFVLASR